MTSPATDYLDIWTTFTYAYEVVTYNNKISLSSLVIEITHAVV